VLAAGLFVAWYAMRLIARREYLDRLDRERAGELRDAIEAVLPADELSRLQSANRARSPR
jgi:hypothetical protein